jgi:hypothetical protein
MRKYLVATLLALTGAVQAQVFVSPWFTPPPPFQEDFDAIPPGSYASAGLFGFPAGAYTPTAGGWLNIAPPVFPNPPAFSASNTIMGVASGVGIKVGIPMRRFGGYFRTNVNSAGLANTLARLIFFDAQGNVIGVATINLSPVWTQFAWQTFPRWHHVEVYGAPFGPGGVEMDSIWVRPI